jgi:vacuolar-type H+-ATPase subunit F/Vma7
VVAIADGHLALQFALAGVAVDEVSGIHEAEDALEKCLASDARLAIVQASFRDGFSPGFRDRLALHRGLPLVVYCPSFDTDDADVDSYLADVLRPAVGYEIRLE